MGGRVLFALSIAAFPEDLPRDVLTEIFAGASAKVREAGGTLAGGHTIRDPEPKYGLAVIGAAHPDQLLRKGGARPGDRLVLTKRLGTGVLVSGHRQGRTSEADLATAIDGMRRLNRAASEALVARRHPGRHGRHRVRPARPRPRDGPRVRDALRLRGGRPAGTPRRARARRRRRRDRRRRPQPPLRRRRARGRRRRVRPDLVTLAHDPQTSGGLLAAVPPDRVADVEAAFDAAGVERWWVGRGRSRRAGAERRAAPDRQLRAAMADNGRPQDRHEPASARTAEEAPHAPFHRRGRARRDPPPRHHPVPRRHLGRPAVPVRAGRRSRSSRSAAPGSIGFLSWAAVLVLVNRFARPVLVALTGRLLFSTMGFFVVIINAIAIYITSIIAPDQDRRPSPTRRSCGSSSRRRCTPPCRPSMDAVLGLNRPDLGADRSRGIWGFLESLPTPRRNVIIENLRLQQVYNADLHDEPRHRPGRHAGRRDPPLVRPRRARRQGRPRRRDRARSASWRCSSSSVRPT